MEKSVDDRLLPGERLCEMGRRGLLLIQRPGDGCFSQDSVLLADFSGVKRGSRVCDLGAGDGALALLLLAREPDISCELVEIRADLCRRARRSVLLNHLENRVQAHCLNLCQAPEALGKGGFDLVVSNPPYHQLTRDEMAPEKRLARQQAACDFPALAKSAAALLRHHGRFCLCVPAARVFEAAEALKAQGLMPKRLRFVAAFGDRAPYLCLLEGQRGAKAGLRVLPQLIQFMAPGQWSPEMARIYHESEEMA